MQGTACKNIKGTAFPSYQFAKASFNGNRWRDVQPRKPLCPVVRLRSTLWREQVLCAGHKRSDEQRWFMVHRFDTETHFRDW